jgi:hypothetical protein
MPLALLRTWTDVDHTNARAYYLTRKLQNGKEQILPPATSTKKGSKIQPTPSHNGTIVMVKTKIFKQLSRENGLENNCHSTVICRYRLHEKQISTTTFTRADIDNSADTFLFRREKSNRNKQIKERAT